MPIVSSLAAIFYHVNERGACSCHLSVPALFPCFHFLFFTFSKLLTLHVTPLDFLMIQGYVLL